MESRRRTELSAEPGQVPSVLLLADPAWPFEPVALVLWNLGYTGGVARTQEEARTYLSASHRRVDVVVACSSTGREDGLQLVLGASSTRPELRVLVILDLERCAAPLVIARRLARLPNVTSMIELAASPERIASRIGVLLNRPWPVLRTTPLDRVA